METRLKMNYLNSYKIFESSNQDIISDINDIFLLDIKDIDNEYNIDVNRPPLPINLKDKIIVEISKFWRIRNIPKRVSFEVEEIEDGVHRILNYMNDLGYKNEILTKLNKRDDWTKLVMKEGDYTRYKLGPFEWKFDKRVSRIKITFESEIS